MPLYMYQAAYTSESWAAQLKNPQNRIETVGRQACEAVGGKLVGGWYCFGEYDVVFICDVPNNESMSAIALAVAAGGALKSGKTTVLMTGAEGVGGMQKADAVARPISPPDRLVVGLRTPASASQAGRPFAAGLSVRMRVYSHRLGL